MDAKKWGIYRAVLDSVIGSEQGKTRPVLVISEDGINDLLNVVNVLPITSRKPQRRIYLNEALIPANHFGLPNESTVLCYQIRTIDKLRLTLMYGTIDSSENQKEILIALCFQLGIEFQQG